MAIQDCHDGNQSKWMVTAHGKWDRFAIEMGYFIQFALANQAACRHMDFWRMLEFFLSIQYTNTLYNQISHEVDNIIYLVMALHLNPAHPGSHWKITSTF